MRCVFCLVLVLRFSVPTIACAPTQKKINFERECEENNIFQAPEFDLGENLSFDNCGQWDETKSPLPPWRAKIVGIHDRHCYGILISKRYVLTRKCNFHADKFWAAGNATSGWRILLGKCFDENHESCKEEGKGQILKVEKVHKLNFSDQFHLWETGKTDFERSHTWPVCLFNKEQNEGLDVENAYRAFHTEWVENKRVKVLRTRKCVEKIVPERCDELKNSICVRQDLKQWHSYLLREDRNRFFLRGIVYVQTEENYHIFTDLLPFTREIVYKADDIFIMPSVPQAKPKTDFRSVAKYLQKQCRNASETLRRNNLPGFRTSTDLVVGGAEAVKNKHPWHVRLAKSDEETAFCGGTLISENVVLTAAHCVASEKNWALFVILGSHVKDDNEEKETQFLMPDKVVVHEKYDAISNDNDVALLLFNGKGFNVTESVKPICLWNQNYNFESIVNKQAEVVGWGNTENHTQPANLHKVNLTILPHQACYGKSKAFFASRLKPGRNFCAGDTGKSACNGDSGGGLVIYEDGEAFLRGVVSFGVVKNFKGSNGIHTKSCNPDFPSIYIDLANNMDWIVQTVSDFFKNYAEN